MAVRFVIGIIRIFLKFFCDGVNVIHVCRFEIFLAETPKNKVSSFLDNVVLI